MADVASKRAFINDLLRDIRAYRAHLVPRRTSILRAAIPAAIGAVTTALATPAAGAAAAGITTRLVAAGRFHPYESPYGASFRHGLAVNAQRVISLQRQLSLLVPSASVGLAGIARARLRATAGDAIVHIK